MTSSVAHGGYWRSNFPSSRHASSSTFLTKRKSGTDRQSLPPASPRPLAEAAMTPYHDLVGAIERLARDGKNLPLGGLPPAPHPQIAPDAARVLIFSPHPDD